MAAASKDLVSVEPQRPAWVAGTALTPLALASGIGAVFASSCCAIPLVLAGLGAGSATFSLLAALASYRVPLLIMGATILGVAWLLYFRRLRERCDANGCQPMRSSVAIPLILGLSTALLSTAAGWSLIEPTVLQFVRTAS